jgi:two-component sensor histidine kinase
LALTHSGEFAVAAIRMLQRWVTRGPRGVGPLALGVIAAVAVPTLLQLAVHPVLGDMMAFAVYYPADLIVVLLLGWPAGVVSLALSLLAANFFFLEPRFSFSFAARDAAAMSLFVVGDGLIVVTAALLRLALQRLGAAHDHQVALKREIQHRLKNTLAMVQAMAGATARLGGDPASFYETLKGRIAALAEAHDLLLDGRWDVCPAPELVARALRPFAYDGRMAIDGEEAILAPEGCVPLALALHELATNAVKYGALSNSTGRVAVTWCVSEPGAASLTLRWKETGGPAVRAPARRGMGSRLLIKQPGLEKVNLRFEPDGVSCEIAAPLAMRPPPRAAVGRRGLRFPWPRFDGGVQSRPSRPAEI